MSRTSIASRAARWSAKHRRIAILGWIAFVVLSIVIGGKVGTEQIADEDLGNGESRQGEQVLADAGFPDNQTEQVLIQTRGDSTVDDPAFRAAVSEVVARLSHVEHVTEIESPLTDSNAGQVSADRRSAIVTFELRGGDDAVVDRVEAPLAAVGEVQSAHPEYRIEEVGDASIMKAFDESLAEDFQRAEMLSLPITLLILVVAFGALVAAGVPLLLALSAVAATLGLLGPISQIVPLDEAINSVVLLIGLAVGVDYSLFYLRRERAERHAGRSNEEALEIAAATSGRAVLVSGMTVAIAMAGMFLTGNATFMSFAIGTIVVVAVAVLGSLTVLPATLSKLGDRVEKGRIPLIGRIGRRDGSDSRVWSAILDRVLRRPAISAALAGAVLVTLAIPALHMDTKEIRCPGPASGSGGREDVQPDPGRVPGRAPAGGRRHRGRGCRGRGSRCRCRRPPGSSDRLRPHERPCRL